MNSFVVAGFVSLGLLSIVFAFAAWESHRIAQREKLEAQEYFRAKFRSLEEEE